jgi:hypothetical protein
MIDLRQEEMLTEMEEEEEEIQAGALEVVV